MLSIPGMTDRIINNISILGTCASGIDIAEQDLSPGRTFREFTGGPVRKDCGIGSMKAKEVPNENGTDRPCVVFIGRVCSCAGCFLRYL